MFTLFASTSFLLIVIVALFAGDTVPSEASWSSLRYLLAAPVRRERLLRQKLIVAGLSSVVALVFLPAWTLLIGGLAYGWGPMIGPTGEQLPWPTMGGRLLIIIGYLLISLTVVAAFAFAIGVMTDAPLAAVGGAVLLMILSAILDSITALGGIREGLPGHYAYAWADALAPTVDCSDMITGALWSIGYAIVWSASPSGTSCARTSRRNVRAIEPSATVARTSGEVLGEELLDSAPGVGGRDRLGSDVAELDHRPQHGAHDHGPVVGVVQETVSGIRIDLDVVRHPVRAKGGCESRHVLDEPVMAAVADDDRAGRLGQHVDVVRDLAVVDRAGRRSRRRPTAGRIHRRCRSRSPRPGRCSPGSSSSRWRQESIRSNGLPARAR